MTPTLEELQLTAIQAQREFIFRDFNSLNAPNFPGNAAWYQQFPDGRIGLDGAVKLQLDPRLKTRFIYLYLFALIPTALGANWGWCLLNVKLFLKNVLVVAFPVSVHYQPGNVPFRNPKPTNSPSTILTGGVVDGPMVNFVPLDPLTLPFTVNSPEPAQTVLQPWPVNFPADALQVDIVDTCLASGGHRIVACSYAF